MYVYTCTVSHFTIYICTIYNFTVFNGTVHDFTVYNCTVSYYTVFDCTDNCYVGGDLYAATVSDFSGSDSLIIKNQLRTEQYDYKHLNGQLFSDK